jgi:hypothetical protein
MSETVVETRAISVWHIIIFAMLCFYMVIGVSAIVKGWREWLMIFVFFGFFGYLFFGFLFSILFSKLKVYEDGISFGMYHVFFDEMGRIKLKFGGRLLVFGKLNWCLLLNPNKFVEAVKAVKPEILVEYRKPVRRWKPIIYSIILLASFTGLWGVERILNYIGIVIDPFIWALVCGITVTISATAWTYWLPPHRYRILGLGRFGTSVAIGLVMGIPIFLIMLTRLVL